MITNTDVAGLFTVFARTYTHSKGANGVSAFLVPAASPGLSLGAPERKMGQKGAQVCDVRLLRIYESSSQIQQLVIARNMIRAARHSHGALHLNRRFEH